MLKTGVLFQQVFFSTIFLTRNLTFTDKHFKTVVIDIFRVALLQVIFIPWSIKALMGATSDLYPLFGYHKRSYMLVATGVGSLSLAVLGGTTFNADNATAAVPLLFLVMFQVAMVDLLCEGKYAEMMRRLPHTKGDAVSFVRT